jgi:hypothetical protein
VDSKSEAEETKDDLVQLGADPRHLEIVPPGESVQSDSDTSKGDVEGVGEADPVTPEEHQEAKAVESSTGTDPLPESKPDLDTDPIEWMPSHFVDEIQGVPTLNRKGYAVMAEQFGVSAKAEPIVRASESDFEYAEYRGVAVTADGVEYTDIGSAHVERMDGDDKYLLNELAATRAKKRAASWALGVGMTAKEEMDNTL